LKDPEARRAYHRAYMQRYLQDPENKRAHIARVRRNDAKTRQRVDAVIAEWKSDGCSLCDETEECCLIAHHLDPTTKSFEIGDGRTKKVGPKRIQEELDKCMCLCMNCHAKVHAGLWEIVAS